MLFISNVQVAKWKFSPKEFPIHHFSPTFFIFLTQIKIFNFLNFHLYFVSQIFQIFSPSFLLSLSFSLFVFLLPHFLFFCSSFLSSNLVTSFLIFYSYGNCIEIPCPPQLVLQWSIQILKKFKFNKNILNRLISKKRKDKKKRAKYDSKKFFQEKTISTAHKNDREIFWMTIMYTQNHIEKNLLCTIFENRLPVLKDSNLDLWNQTTTCLTTRPHSSGARRAFSHIY